MYLSFCQKTIPSTLCSIIRFTCHHPLPHRFSLSRPVTDTTRETLIHLVRGADYRNRVIIIIKILRQR